MLSKMKKLAAFAVAILALGCVGQALQINQIEFDLKVDPGKTYTLSFQVRNDAQVSQTITVYLGDWDRSPTGEHRYYPPGTLERSLCEWLTVVPTRIVLAPGETGQITATLTVPSPEERELAGTYWGMIFVQGEPRPMEVEGTVVMAVERFGVKVYATVAGTARTAGVVRKVEAQATSDGVLVKIEYQNTGNVHQEVGGTVRVIDRKGDIVQEKEVEPAPVLPGAERIFEVTLPALPPGIYQVQAMLDYGGEVMVAGVTGLRVRRP